MQGQGSLGTESEAPQGEKRPRERTLTGSFQVQGVCFGEEEFLTVEMHVVESTVRPPLAITKLP